MKKEKKEKKHGVFMLPNCSFCLILHPFLFPISESSESHRKTEDGRVLDRQNQEPLSRLGMSSILKRHLAVFIDCGTISCHTLIQGCFCLSAIPSHWGGNQRLWKLKVKRNIRKLNLFVVLKHQILSHTQTILILYTPALFKSWLCDSLVRNYGRGWGDA